MKRKADKSVIYHITRAFVFMVPIMLVCIGCSGRIAGTYSCHLIKSGTKEFLLLDNTGPVSRSVAYYENKDGSYYVHFNMSQSMYLVYNYGTRELISKIRFKKLTSPAAACFISFDSIIYIYDIDKNIVAITDSSERAINYIDTKSDRTDGLKIPVYCKNYAPVCFRNGQLFYVNMRVGASLIMPGTIEPKRHEKTVGGCIDVKTGERRNLVFYPDNYYKASYGHVNSNDIYSCFTDNEMIVSFPASEYLFKYSLDNYTVDSIKCKSDYFKKIKPLKKDRHLESFNDEESLKYFSTTPTWSAIVFDKYRDVFYRFAELPNTEQDFDPKNTMKSLRKRISIIILDRDFEKKGESFIGKGYNIMGAIVTPDGLLLSRLDNDKSKITYDIFKLAENE
jgi:hypothetical protein